MQRETASETAAASARDISTQAEPARQESWDQVPLPPGAKGSSFQRSSLLPPPPQVGPKEPIPTPSLGGPLDSPSRLAIALPKKAPLPRIDQSAASGHLFDVDIEEETSAGETQSPELSYDQDGSPFEAAANPTPPYAKLSDTAANHATPAPEASPALPPAALAHDTELADFTKQSTLPGFAPVAPPALTAHPLDRPEAHPEGRPEEEIDIEISFDESSESQMGLPMQIQDLPPTNLKLDIAKPSRRGTQLEAVSGEIRRDSDTDIDIAVSYDWPESAADQAAQELGQQLRQDKDTEQFIDDMLQDSHRQPEISTPAMSESQLGTFAPRRTNWALVSGIAVALVGTSYFAYQSGPTDPDNHAAGIRQKAASPVVDPFVDKPQRAGDDSSAAGRHKRRIRRQLDPADNAPAALVPKTKAPAPRKPGQAPQNLAIDDSPLVAPTPKPGANAPAELNSGEQDTSSAPQPPAKAENKGQDKAAKEAPGSAAGHPAAGHPAAGHPAQTVPKGSKIPNQAPRDAQPPSSDPPELGAKSKAKAKTTAPAKASAKVPAADDELAAKIQKRPDPSGHKSSSLTQNKSTTAPSQAKALAAPAKPKTQPQPKPGRPEGLDTAAIQIQADTKKRPEARTTAVEAQDQNQDKNQAQGLDKNLDQDKNQDKGNNPTAKPSAESKNKANPRKTPGLPRPRKAHPPQPRHFLKAKLDDQGKRVAPGYLSAAQRKAYLLIPVHPDDRRPMGKVSAAGVYIDQLVLGTEYKGNECQGRSVNFSLQRNPIAHVCVRLVHRDNQSHAVRIEWLKGSKIVHRHTVTLQAGQHFARGYSKLNLAQQVQASGDDWSLRVLDPDGVLLYRRSFSVRP